MASSPLTIALPPGDLGVGIQRAEDGACVVTTQSNPASPLVLHDIIISLNGIALREVAGGVAAWVGLFRACGAGPRTLVVRRGPGVAAGGDRYRSGILAALAELNQRAGAFTASTAIRRRMQVSGTAQELPACSRCR
jgi:hypothetical protein